MTPTALTPPPTALDKHWAAATLHTLVSVNATHVIWDDSWPADRRALLLACLAAMAEDYAPQGTTWTPTVVDG